MAGFAGSKIMCLPLILFPFIGNVWPCWCRWPAPWVIERVTPREQNNENKREFEILHVARSSQDWWAPCLRPQREYWECKVMCLAELLQGWPLWSHPRARCVRDTTDCRTETKGKVLAGLEMTHEIYLCLCSFSPCFCQRLPYWWKENSRKYSFVLCVVFWHQTTVIYSSWWEIPFLYWNEKRTQGKKWQLKRSSSE